jgi:hypothetical protein
MAMEAIESVVRPDVEAVKAVDTVVRAYVVDLMVE